MKSEGACSEQASPYSPGQMMHPANGQLKAAETVALYPASTAIVVSTSAEQQEDKKDDEESVCVHCGLIMSGRCLFCLFCFERTGNAWNR